MAFKVIRGRFPSDIEAQLNKLDEDFHPVDVQAITYDHNTSLYTVVCKVGQEVLPCTTYNKAMLEVEGFPHNFNPFYGRDMSEFPLADKPKEK